MIWLILTIFSFYGFMMLVKDHEQYNRRPNRVGQESHWEFLNANGFMTDEELQANYEFKRLVESWNYTSITLKEWMNKK